MTMPTDDERREVARAYRADRDALRERLSKRLRDMAYDTTCCISSTTAYRELFCAVYSRQPSRNLSAHEREFSEFCLLLADLVEPGDMSQSCRDTVACDSEALGVSGDES